MNYKFFNYLSSIVSLYHSGLLFNSILERNLYSISKLFKNEFKHFRM